jgi:mannosyltransferase
MAVMPGNLTSPGATAQGPGSAADDGRPSHRRADWLVVGVPAVAALALGGYRIGGPPLWRDEAYTIIAARRSAGQIVVLLGHTDAVHGPYYLLMHIVVVLLGTSAVAIRLPSLVAMSIAAGFTAALGRRLASTAALPAPPVTGLLAGLLFVAGPRTTYYAQDARPYGLVVMFAVIATYLLVRATADGRWGWWACYSAAIALAGLFNLFALLLVVAHGVTLALARAQARGRQPGGGSGPAGPPPAAVAAGGPGRQPAAEPRTTLPRWLAAVAAAVVVLAPMIYLGYQQGHTLGWVAAPGIHAVIRLVTDFAGARRLVPLVAILALGGAVAGWRSGRPGQPALAVVALPWLVLPPLILISVSQVHPAYVERYVILCIPALALLSAAGFAGLARLVAMTPAAGPRPALAWAPAAVILAVIAVLLIGPQHLAGPTAARPDDLRAAAAVVAANARPGDAVCYVPPRTRVVSFAYPTPFRRLRDLALAKSPAASATLVGTQVQPPTLRSRFAGVRRVWLVQWARQRSARPRQPTGRAELALIAGTHLVRRWHVRSMVLSLYVAG